MALRYLGIRLTPHISRIFEANFPPLLKTIEADLVKWHPKHFSWFGRAAICKMSVLPRLLYLLRTLPINIPDSFFKWLQLLQFNFVWAHRCPCIKFHLLTKGKADGGMGLPDYRQYYYASHVTRIVDWHCHGTEKDWVFLENTLSVTPLRFLPWIPWAGSSAALRNHPLVSPTLQIFRKLKKNLSFSSQLGPLTPLKNNPDFPPGIGNCLLQSLTTATPLLASQCFLNGHIKDYTVLKTDIPSRNFLCGPTSKFVVTSPLPDIEDFLQDN